VATQASKNASTAAMTTRIVVRTGCRSRFGAAGSSRREDIIALSEFADSALVTS
jgi:hypothetical protein